MGTQDIFEFTNHRDFLQNYLSPRTRARGVRALARRAGFKSASYLSMLIHGERRLTARSAELLAKALALKGRRRALLLAFSRLDLGQSEVEKQAAREEILRLKSSRPEFQLSAKHYSFLAVWYYPVLYALLEKDLPDTGAAVLARFLGRGVDAPRVEKALSDLHDLGLVIKDPEGRWRARHAALTTPDDVRDLAIGAYHRNGLELAHAALALPLSEREFNGLTVGIPRGRLELVKEKMRLFRMELNELLSSDTAPADIYQLNLQLFPVTTGAERMEE